MTTTRPTRTRRLALALALAAGVALAPTAAGAADGYKTPTPTPPPPVGADDIVAPRPLLSIELDDAEEHDGAIEGRLLLSSPLTRQLTASVDLVFPDAEPGDVICPMPDMGYCTYAVGVAIPAGQTEVPFEIGLDDDGTGEDAERLRVAIGSTLPATAVRVGPPDEGVIYDGDGLQLRLVDDPEGVEGDAGSDGTLDLVVEADQALPDPVSLRVYTGAAGGYNAALPGVDFTPTDVVAELPAGATSVTVEVPLVGDDLDEGPYELTFVYAADPSHGEVPLDGTGKLARILDDDGPVVTWTRPGGYQSPSRSARSAAFTA